MFWRLLLFKHHLFLIAFSIAILALFFGFIKLPKVLEESPKGGYLKPFKNKGIFGGLGYFCIYERINFYWKFLVNYFSEMNLPAVITQNETMM
jgi:FHS family L-fucose permease-like MFS transporter